MSKLRRFRSALSNFAEESTVHGLPQVKSPPVKWFRLIWVLMVLTCTAIGMLQMVRFFLRYASLPIEVDTEVGKSVDK